MNKASLLVLFLLGAFGILIVQTVPKDTFNLPKQAETASKRGGKWLQEYSGNYQDPGIVWIVKKINDTYCQSTELENFIQTKFQEFENHPIEQYYRVLIDNDTSRIIDYTLLTGRENRFDDIILPTLYCHTQFIPETTLKKIFSYDSLSGYQLSHHFLALQFMKENRCLGEQKIQTSLDQIVKKMAKEQLLTPAFSDLFSERTAFLQYGEYKNLVKEQWIQTIVQNQNPSGAWKDPVHFEQKENPHTTALSVWALTNYTQVCPF